VGKNPMKIAKILSLVISHQSSENGVFEKIEVVQPGYLNFYLSSQQTVFL